MKKVAFICYGNSCRSQIAEGLSLVLGKNLYQAYSAGTHPLGRISPEVYKIMERRGIDISDQYSKGLDAIPLHEADFVITMGCCSANQICPASCSGTKIDWDIPDPYGRGIDEFERVSQIIERKLKDFIKENFNQAELLGEIGCRL